MKTMGAKDSIDFINFKTMKFMKTKESNDSKTFPNSTKTMKPKASMAFMKFI